MLKNDLKMDYKMIQLKSSMTWVEIGKKVGKTNMSASQVVRGKIISQTFIDAMDAMGYDIQIVYVPKEK